MENPITNVELERASAANEIRLIDKQIFEIENTKDFQKLQYLGSTIPILSKKGLTTELEAIETELVEIRSKYTENAQIVKTIIKRRDLMIVYLSKDR